MSDQPTALSVAILEAVAEGEGTDITDLPPLDGAIDPAALDQLFALKLDGTPRDGGQVRFSYAGYTVTVHSDASIELDEHDP